MSLFSIPIIWLISNYINNGNFGIVFCLILLEAICTEYRKVLNSLQMSLTSSLVDFIKNAGWVWPIIFYYQFNSDGLNIEVISAVPFAKYEKMLNPKNAKRKIINTQVNILMFLIPLNRPLLLLDVVDEPNDIVFVETLDGFNKLSLIVFVEVLIINKIHIYFIMA